MTTITTPEGGEFLTPADLAARWKGKISVGTLRNWRAKGLGPAFTKISSTGILYPLQAVEAYERAKMAGAAGEAAAG
jgi:hypothetical protein